ncbi:MAG: XrtA system polysaccharide chain length determinant [Pseudomonadota bacterium]
MQEILAQVFSYIWGVWRHRWLALSVAWVVAIGGWIWVWQLPEAYVAQARVYVDTNTVLRPLLQGLATQPNVENRIGLLSRTLLSRPNLEKLMRMTDLDLQVTTAKEKDTLLNDLAKSITLNAGRKDKSLYSISVQDPDRDTAKRVAQALITVFIESSLSGKREHSSGAQDFLDQQIGEYEDRLIASETRTANYRQENRQIIGGRGGYYNNLNNARSRLKQARLMLREEQNKIDNLQRQIDGEDPFYLPPPEATGGPVGIPLRTASSLPATQLDSQIASISGQIAALKVKYTDRHPQVRLLLNTLDDLQERKGAERREMLAKMESANARARKKNEQIEEDQKQSEDQFADLSGLSNSPVYLNMRQMQSSSKSRVAGLKVRVQQYEEELADLESKSTLIPEVEGRLKQLQRSSSVISSQLAGLIKRRETARMGQDVEKKANDVTFRVIDPPYVPMKPSEPNKVLLNGMVLVAALGAGIGVSFLVSLIYPVFFDSRSLTSATGLPILGSVSINLQQEQKMRERYASVAFSMLTTFLLVAYVGMTLWMGDLPWS